MCPTNIALILNYPVIITIVLEEVMVEIEIKGVDHGEQGSGNRIEGLGLQIITLNIVTHNLPSSLPLQPSLMVVLLCFQHHATDPQKPNEVKLPIMESIQHKMYGMRSLDTHLTQFLLHC
ncbi:hypothetical protein SADUNF_Sadunf16G0122100 [Salix dunnii]|uniref:Uncharacterized protein n=1 Tax=Salix dunnii TaxID=1413687 RepID=A0A835JAQ1_9ROSI|nr:hypothetical protein SADUNF_Sadunf16G0122100 [Salix dunnii]